MSTIPAGRTTDLGQLFSDLHESGKLYFPSEKNDFKMGQTGYKKPEGRRLKTDSARMFGTSAWPRENLNKIKSYEVRQRENELGAFLFTPDLQEVLSLAKTGKLSNPFPSKVADSKSQQRNKQGFELRKRFYKANHGKEECLPTVGVKRKVFDGIDSKKTLLGLPFTRRFRREDVMPEALLKSSVHYGGAFELDFMSESNECSRKMQSYIESALSFLKQNDGEPIDHYPRKVNFFGGTKIIGTPRQWENLNEAYQRRFPEMEADASALLDNKSIREITVEIVTRPESIVDKAISSASFEGGSGSFNQQKIRTQIQQLRNVQHLLVEDKNFQSELTKVAFRHSQQKRAAQQFSYLGEKITLLCNAYELILKNPNLSDSEKAKALHNLLHNHDLFGDLIALLDDLHSFSSYLQQPNTQFKQSIDPYQQRPNVMRKAVVTGLHCVPFIGWMLSAPLKTGQSLLHGKPGKVGFVSSAQRSFRQAFDLPDKQPVGWNHREIGKIQHRIRSQLNLLEKWGLGFMLKPFRAQPTLSTLAARTAFAGSFAAYLASWAVAGPAIDLSAATAATLIGFSSDGLVADPVHHLAVASLAAVLGTALKYGAKAVDKTVLTWIAKLCNLQGDIEFTQQCLQNMFVILHNSLHGPFKLAWHVGATLSDLGLNNAMHKFKDELALKHWLKGLKAFCTDEITEEDSDSSDQSGSDEVPLIKAIFSDEYRQTVLSYIFQKSTKQVEDNSDGEVSGKGEKMEDSLSSSTGFSKGVNCEIETSSDTDNRVGTEDGSFNNGFFEFNVVGNEQLKDSATSLKDNKKIEPLDGDETDLKQELDSAEDYLQYYIPLDYQQKPTAIQLQALQEKAITKTDTVFLKKLGLSTAKCLKKGQWGRFLQLKTLKSEALQYLKGETNELSGQCKKYLCNLTSDLRDNYQEQRRSIEKNHIQENYSWERVTLEKRLDRALKLLKKDVVHKFYQEFCLKGLVLTEKQIACALFEDSNALNRSVPHNLKNDLTRLLGKYQREYQENREKFERIFELTRHKTAELRLRDAAACKVQDLDKKTIKELGIRKWDYLKYGNLYGTMRAKKRQQKVLQHLKTVKLDQVESDGKAAKFNVHLEKKLSSVDTGLGVHFQEKYRNIQETFKLQAWQEAQVRRVDTHKTLLRLSLLTEVRSDLSNINSVKELREHISRNCKDCDYAQRSSAEKAAALETALKLVQDSRLIEENAANQKKKDLERELVFLQDYLKLLQQDADADAAAGERMTTYELHIADRYFSQKLSGLKALLHSIDRTSVNQGFGSVARHTMTQEVENFLECFPALHGKESKGVSRAVFNHEINQGVVMPLERLFKNFDGIEEFIPWKLLPSFVVAGIVLTVLGIDFSKVEGLKILEKFYDVITNGNQIAISANLMNELIDGSLHAAELLLITKYMVEKGENEAAEEVKDSIKQIGPSLVRKVAYQNNMSAPQCFKSLHSDNISSSWSDCFGTR